MARPATLFRLTPAQQAELGARLRQATMAPRLRVRLQVGGLVDDGVGEVDGVAVVDDHARTRVSWLQLPRPASLAPRGA